MREETIETLTELLGKYKVEIPVVQRDYVQGRQEEHAKVVRHTLLNDMKSAVLEETLPLDLGFVYGKTEKGTLIPLDGQQRLTTLFLLYLYGFREEENMALLERFTYKTRVSSRKFMEKLVEHRREVFDSSLAPSREIQDSEWFLTAWNYDPTVQSVLVVLDEIKQIFGNVADLGQRLSDLKKKPVRFKFLDMEELGMEDSLYIKLNARGKPLTPLENFKARLSEQIKTLSLDFTARFERAFDLEWTELFWSRCKKEFDSTYLAFFQVLLANHGLGSMTDGWSDVLDYEKVDEAMVKTAFFTLNFLWENPDAEEVHTLIFRALREERSYGDRVLFHAVTVYLHGSQGKDKGGLGQWIRVFKNLTANSQIDTTLLYERSINSINGLEGKRDSLLKVLAGKGEVSLSGFSQKQVEEERIKARILLEDKEFGKEIHKAEKHPYFSGQIRAALYPAQREDKTYSKRIFIRYWKRIDALFGSSGPKEGHLLRQALLTFGDYTLPVDAYRTLCVDDPRESASTPSLKRLFSDYQERVGDFLKSLNRKEPMREQMERMVKEAKVPKTDWRYCFLKVPDLFTWMSASHLRLRFTDKEVLIVPNKSSSGFNYEIFTAALSQMLKKEYYFDGYFGTWGERWLWVGNVSVAFADKRFVAKDEEGNVVYKTKTEDPLREAARFLNRIGDL